MPLKNAGKSDRIFNWLFMRGWGNVSGEKTRKGRLFKLFFVYFKEKTGNEVRKRENASSCTAVDYEGGNPEIRTLTAAAPQITRTHLDFPPGAEK